MQKSLGFFFSMAFAAMTLELNAQSVELTRPVIGPDVVFNEENGVAVVESEHFYKQEKTDLRQWFITSKGRIPEVTPDPDGAHIAGASGNAYIEILPDTRRTPSDKLIKLEDPKLNEETSKLVNFTDLPGKIAILHYKVNINKPGRYYVWVRAHSTGPEDNSMHVGFNGTWPANGQRMQWCDGKNQWTWESKQRTEKEHCGVPKEIYLDIDKAGIQDIQFSLREDGFEFDKFLLTNDINYIPEGEGPAPKLLRGSLPAPFPKTETIGVFSDNSFEQIKFAAGDIESALESKGFTVEMLPLSSLNAKYSGKKVVIALSSDAEVTKLLSAEGGTIPAALGEQAYGLRTTNKRQLSYWVLGGDTNGAMYGGFQVAENILFEGFSGTWNKQEAPYMLNRGMKLNLPLDKRIPTYVGGWTSFSTQKAIPHVWDMTFWKKLIDQQARYRYNVLSVWVHHPFPALVKLTDYPRASLPNIEGFDGFVKELNHDQRVAFWREVMQYAHSRGMKFYFFNWNIYLDYARDQYPDLSAVRTNTTTLDYMYKSMQALIETYPDLDGFGISAGDGMMAESQAFNADSRLKTQWTWDAMGKAVMDYMALNPSRKFNLIHRGIGSSPEILNEKYAPLKEVKNVALNYSHKYSQAHMYSTPTPQWTNSIESATKVGIKSWITVRNDDYFYFNWGDPRFVRDYMHGIPDKETVTGMYIGSDGYSPSRTYFCKNDAMNGQLEVERRWYMEMLWGRISYNPETSDNVFQNILAKRFPGVSGENLFKAWSLASGTLPKVTELIMGNWSLDFHWYPEGCWSDPGRGTGFRTIDGFANETTVAKGSKLCDIATSAAGNCGDKKSSYKVADEMQADAEKALSLINGIKGNGNADLEMAIDNVKQMASLGVYYAHKVRGATYKKSGQTEKAREEMAKAYCWWINYTRLMEATYYGDSFRNHSIKPDWKYADAAALKEYTDLGGAGVPECK